MWACDSKRKTNTNDTFYDCKVETGYNQFFFCSPPINFCSSKVFGTWTITKDAQDRIKEIMVHPNPSDYHLYKLSEACRYMEIQRNCSGMRPLKDGAVGWADGLVNKVLPLQTWGTEFSLQFNIKRLWAWWLYFYPWCQSGSGKRWLAPPGHSVQPN